MKRLSIILPVYNVEKYLERCIRSLEDQDIPHDAYEVVVVNDGSPDNSRDVVLRLMKEFANIVFIEQQNKGVSLARNAGIAKATGQYLLFVDPDDYVDANSFGRILGSATANRADVVFLGFTILDVQGKPVREIFHSREKGKVFTGIDAYVVSRGDGTADPDRSWSILYERQFLKTHDLQYIPNVPYLEDGEFIARVLCLAQRCTFDGQSFYQRTTRPGSATNSNLFSSQRAINGFVLAVKNLISFRKSGALTVQQQDFLNQPICKFLLLALIPFCSFSRMADFRSTVKRLKEAGLGKCNVKKCNNYYKIEGGLYNVSPYLFFLHRVFKAPLLRVVRP